ncbi:hypothetical protein EWM64_g4841 [Hericium alpestre]|uniref:NmrA-like domain-containing protein n=1 Tax=Hericium alpestre TaxID=135208 RepID=A0A4Y9ZWH4_9AGAM|nr:hypothetical protein EWM64_g4841 [Hericium alpestre]
MSGYRNLAVAGAGNIGVFIIEELLKQKDAGLIDNVYILTRATSNNPDIPRLIALGAKPVGVDYSSTEGLTKALAPLNLDVLISTLGHVGTSLEVQWPLVDAIKAANIKLFVPSEFGNPTDGVTGGLLGKKGSLHDVLKEKGVNAAYFYTGPFADMIFEGYLEWDLAKGKAETAMCRCHIPQGAILAGDRKTFNELFKQYEERTGVKLTPNYRSKEELERTLEENPKHFSSMLQYSFLTHGGTVGRLDQLDNGEFPKWNPTKAIEFIARN